MSNMSYCRFQNTVSDLRDCSAHVNEKISYDEQRARRQLVDVCKLILEAVGIDCDMGAEPEFGDDEESEG